MNKLILKGILRNIRPSHTIGGIAYDQADIICARDAIHSDSLSLKFKKYCNKYNDGDMIEISGNIRSYSEKLKNGKNKVNLYVFTYFDLPDIDATNHFEVDGRICKIDELRYTSSGKCSIHFIVANNLIIEETNQKLNSYLPCIAWGNLARRIAELHVNDKILITGEFHSREYKKKLDNDEYEFKVAHELFVKSFEVLS